MGTAVDSEAEALPTAAADGDDTDNTDDEDGLNDPVGDLSLVVGDVPSVDVTVTNLSGSDATLYGWIDYNGNGAFEVSEKAVPVVVSNGTIGGTVTLDFLAVPWVTPAVTSTYARFRLSTDPASAEPTGAASDGEVEDYTATIEYATIPVGGRHIFYDGSSWDGGNPGPNGGPSPNGDDAAIATDKNALIPDGGTTAGFDNFTSYSNGITGIMVDINGLAGTPTLV